MKGIGEQILNASSNLLGFCFVILTSLKLFNVADRTLVDEFLIVTLVLFMTSCLLSFLAIRSTEEKGKKIEKAAEFTFMTGLFLLFATTLLFAFDVLG